MEKEKAYKDNHRPPTIKAIAFDLGGVLIGSSGEALKIPIKTLKNTAWEDSLPIQKGKETSVIYWRRVAKKLRLRPQQEMLLRKLWIKQYKKEAKLNRGVIALVRKLKTRYPLALISNTREEHTRFNRKRKLFQYFDAVILSHEVGLMKPQKQIYLRASRELKILPKNILFIDDGIDAVQGARRAGFQSIRFTSVPKLSRQLKKLGVLR